MPGPNEQRYDLLPTPINLTVWDDWGREVSRDVDGLLDNGGSAEGSSRFGPGPHEGVWLRNGLMLQTATNQPIGNGNVFVHPTPIPITFSCDAIEALVNAGDAGSQFRLVIYGATDGLLPGGLLYSSDQISGETSGTKTHVIDPAITVPAGLVYTGVWAEVGNPVFRAARHTEPNPNFGWWHGDRLTDSGTAFRSGFREDGSSGLPDPWPSNVMPGGPTYGPQRYAPIVMLRAGAQS